MSRAPVYLRGVVLPSVQTAQIDRGVVPFVLLQIGVIALILAMPWLATRLPTVPVSSVDQRTKDGRPTAPRARRAGPASTRPDQRPRYGQTGVRDARGVLRLIAPGEPLPC